MVRLELLAAGVLFLGLVMYAVFAGADFGGGIWTALSSGPRARAQREKLFDAIGPVWETNHVWLIFVVVTLFTAFPKGFADLCTTLLVPLTIALVGITFRGAAFAFRHFGKETGTGVPVLARFFEISSVLTPFALGVSVTAAASGTIYAASSQVRPPLWSWVTPFNLTGGVIGVAVCAYLAPLYMTVRTKGDLQDDFRIRGILAGIVLGVVTALQIPVARFSAPLFADRLFRPWVVAVVCLAVAGGIATQGALWRRRYLWAQFFGAGTVAATIAGFAAAIYPDLLIGTLTLSAAAAPREALVAFLVVVPVGSLVLVPSLIFLYWTFRGEPNPEAPPDVEE
ncbi:cytochrome d ubiquinol oxidase subunit II [Geomonas sp. RF6]|uniref:cytochrome d ubiquinol oxidase subunit II n=1 Tax=Geomonas sp. RF6 TaxID=2897342 RepID=UPI001E6105A0|nr:cytochrome d ubiquinol oxidase subunit II [Geomonas sp. RF6]UFS70453.1 cytochrome d ubiquinol oxidase subunit II [Geomonas sp. RF6]